MPAACDWKARETTMILSRSQLRRAPREALDRLARWLGVARPEVLPTGLVVQEILRRGKLRSRA